MVVPAGNNITYSASLFEGKTPKAIRKFLDSWNPANNFVDEKAFQAFLKAVQSVQDETLRCSTLDRVRTFLDHDVAFYSGEEFVFSCPRALLPHQDFFQMILNSNSEESQKIDGKHQIRSTFSKEALMAFKRYVFDESFDGISPEVLTELHDYLTMISDQNRHEKIEDAKLKYFLDDAHQFEEKYFMEDSCGFVGAFLSHKKISFEKIDNQYQIQLSDFILLFQSHNAPLSQFLCKKISFIKADISDFSALFSIDKKYRRQVAEVILDTKTDADIDKISELRKAFKNARVIAVNLPYEFLEQERDVNQQVVLLSAINNPAIAAEKLQEILLENEALSIAQECLSVYLSMFGKNIEALSHLAKAIELNPKSAYARERLGECLRILRRYEEAVPHLEKAVELNPKSAFARERLGECLRMLDRYEEAVPHLEKAVELNPKSAFACENLGESLSMLSRHKEAILQFEKAIELDPESVFAHEGLGECLRMLGRHKEAIAQFEKAIEFEPEGSVFAREKLVVCQKELDNENLNDGLRKLEI